MFRHAPLDQGKTSIRLVKVLPELSDTLLIRCEVVSAVIPPASKYHWDYEEDGEEDSYESNDLPLASENDAECPTYLCLSYTWGDPVDDIAIEINGKVLKVRENLWSFLHVARKKFTDIHLWIDALCKSHSILERAGRVISKLIKEQASIRQMPLRETTRSNRWATSTREQIPY
jgi:hypothetical protein